MQVNFAPPFTLVASLSLSLSCSPMFTLSPPPLLFYVDSPRQPPSCFPAFIISSHQEIATFYGYPFGLCGDPACPRSRVIYKPFVSGGMITMQQRLYNYWGSLIRVPVEWKFGDIQQCWRMVCEWYVVCVIGLDTHVLF